MLGGAMPGILERLAGDELPDVAVEGAEFFLDGEEGLGVGNGGGDFEAVADDAGIAKEFAGLAAAVAGDFAGVEMVEGGAIVFALVEDGFPAQAGLGALEDEEFEEEAVVVDGEAPFAVVVLDHEGGCGPVAAAP